MNQAKAVPANEETLRNALYAFGLTYNLRVTDIQPGATPGSLTTLAVGADDGPKHGWGLKVTVSVGAYGDGIETNVVAMMRFGSVAWHPMHAPDSFTWTTSEVSQGLPKEFAPEFLKAAGDTYAAAGERWKRTILAHEAANSLALELRADDDREFRGPGYTGMVLADTPEPFVSLSIGKVSAEKARAILAILNSN